MKHFQDEDNDSMKDYETNVTNHYDEDPDDYEGSMVFRHWLEDDNKWSRDHSSECSSCVERDTCNRYGSGNCSHYCYDM